MSEPKHQIGHIGQTESGTIVRISDVRVTEERGPIYAFDYLSDHGDPHAPLTHGGSGFWFNEAEVHPVTDPVRLLRIDLTRQTDAANEARANLRLAKRAIARLRYALSIAAPVPTPPTKEARTR